MSAPNGEGTLCENLPDGSGLIGDVADVGDTRADGSLGSGWRGVCG